MSALSTVPVHALDCRKCHAGQLAKGPQGWVCDHCGFAPFAEGVREKVPAPTPVVVRNPMPEPVRTTDFPSKDRPVAAPVAVLFSAAEPRPGGMHLFWTNAGSGVRFAAEIALQVLPPKEPLELRVLIHNPGPYVLSATLFVQLWLGGSEPRSFQASTGDLPVGSILDATYTLPGLTVPTGCRVSVSCLPCQPSGRLQNPWQAPQLVPFPGSVAPNLSVALASADVRERVHCPKCEARMRWVPAQGGKPRAWVCEECAHRVDTGILN